MLLQSIVEQLDAELDRLQNLRNIVAGLHGSSPLLQKLAPPVPLVPVVAIENKVADSTVAVQRLPPVVRRQRRSTGPRAKAATATALRHAVPQGPVMISPDQLARERANRQPAPKGERSPGETRPAEPPADLDGQSRALASRWFSNGLTS